MMKPGLKIFDDAAALAAGVAGRVAEVLEQAGRSSLVLSGGTTPRKVYEQLALEPVRGRVPWASLEIFWGDERCVAADHPESNYAMAFAALFSRLAVPADHIHRIPVEREPPDEAAKAYEKTLREFFLPGSPSSPATDPEESVFPSFDLILLGMGKDGHTASLFPDDRALSETKRWVVGVSEPVGTPSVPRITITLPVINSARNVLFLVSGADKVKLVRAIFEAPGAAAKSYPAARVKPRGRLTWLIDEGGAN